MKATFDGTSVLTGRDGRVLYDQSGYGRPESDGIRLAPQEALYLLHRQKIEVAGYTFDTLLAEYADQRNFLRSFLVYRDLRERGYVVQTGPHDYRVFRRGEKPGTGESLYLVRVLSERDPVRFTKLIEEVVTARNMRKQYVLAVVDDEDELTYYEIKPQKLTGACAPFPEIGSCDAVLVGKSAMIRISPQSDLEKAGFGKRFDEERLMISPVELLYLMGRGIVRVTRDNATLTPDEFFAFAHESDPELAAKDKVYTEPAPARFYPPDRVQVWSPLPRLLRKERALRSAGACDRKGGGHAHERDLPVGQDGAQCQKEDVVWLCTYYRNSVRRIRPD